MRLLLLLLLPPPPSLRLFLCALFLPRALLCYSCTRFPSSSRGCETRRSRRDEARRGGTDDEARRDEDALLLCLEKGAAMRANLFAGCPTVI